MNENSPVKIKMAGVEDVESVAILFDLYRQFYDQPADSDKCRNYIADRIGNSESVVFLATGEETCSALGFTQLYPTFCSVAAEKIIVLYDLFVIDSARGLGVGRQLMNCAREYAINSGAERIELMTHHTNTRAQGLYESLGYHRDTEFYGYALSLQR